MAMELIVHVGQNSTQWGVVTDAGFLYSSLANIPAGQSAWPNLSDGIQPAAVEISSDNGSGAAGSGFYFARNQGIAFSGLSSDAARDLVADLNYGSGQKEVLPGINPRLGQFVPTANFWIRKVAGGDKVILKAILS